MGLPDILGGVFKGAADIVGTFKMSPADREKLQQSMFALQLKANQQALDYEAQRVAEGAKTIRAEAQSESWLASNWRPCVMMTFAALIVLHWVGLTPDSLPPEQVEDLLDIVRLGLVGYVVGRSGEKVVKEWKRGTK